MDGREYPSDLTAEQLHLIRPFLPPHSSVGRPREVCRRQVVNAILYANRTGCQWRQLPRCFPKWQTVYDLFWHWRLHGVWQTIHDTLRERLRRAEGRKRTPSAQLFLMRIVAGKLGGRLVPIAEDVSRSRSKSLRG